MKFYFPDSQDVVDPSFDFDLERRAVERIRQRDDVYAHEIFSTRPYDGLLVSKGIVDGVGGSGGRYTIAQRQRLLRVGVREFFRLKGTELPVIGDCGAFTYVRESVPPFSVDEVLGFYTDCRFDLGLSVDHVILTYQPKWDLDPADAGKDFAEAVRRQSVTLDLASEFLTKHRAARLPFEAVGVAQGWSPQSYASAVGALQKMGFTYIALGGMVPLKTTEILDCLKAITAVRRKETRLHLLGVTRIEKVAAFAAYGVVSFDSTSPLRQAFKDEKDNYYTMDGTYTALRVPQVDGNPRLLRRIKAGQVPHDRARKLERMCLDVLRGFDEGKASVDAALGVLAEYERLHDPGHDHSDAYRAMLTNRPWARCACNVCRDLGHHVGLFRGAERNRRRGFHNVWVFYRRLRRELGLPIDEVELPTNPAPSSSGVLAASGA